MRTIEKYTIEGAEDWMEWSGVRLADVANEDDDQAMRLGAVGFLSAPAGARSEFDFPYDEVLVVTKGRCTVTTDTGDEVSVAASEAVYLPAGRPGRFRADTDLELVYIASSPYGAANREAKAELLAKR